MKRVISILLISSIIGSTLHLDELVKFPFLINHYFEHKKNNQDISISAFLYMHYVLNKKAESEKDKKSDSQLPFKSTQNYHSHFVPFTFENDNAEIICQSVNNSFTPFKVTKAQSRPFDIWQPPKI